jgi:hypothetical protein
LARPVDRARYRLGEASKVTNSGFDKKLPLDGSKTGDHVLDLLESAGNDPIESLAQAVRRLVATGFSPTLTEGDRIGPVADGDELCHLTILDVFERGFHLLHDALVEAVSLGEEFAVVLNDRIYSIVRFDRRLTRKLAHRANAAAELGRVTLDHESAVDIPLAIVAFVDCGDAVTVSTPHATAGTLSPPPDVAGITEIRSTLYLVTE